ncbi:AHH domain-containing protein [Vibrio sp. ZSDE26]|uniref:AHH domain-containing protein n=1 Tax=Vibrio amylolyticus TaxID=2847292 RepID=A0A9X2BJR0_9VIBR|nr:AHH domain-containing protein [Vibrio amylolyticus]MCK6263677.1 AHH domain-containing protein [Vibrio amylolyticus]
MSKIGDEVGISGGSEVLAKDANIADRLNSNVGGEVPLGLPAPNYNVPEGFTVKINSSGQATVSGPRGGEYLSTGYYSSDGKLIYKDKSGSYHTLDGGRNSVNAPPNYDSVPIHHICTNKCNVGANGQTAWSKEFQRFFDGSDLNINNATENLVAVAGHRGPHPQAYHQYVYGRLDQATEGLVPNTEAYKEAVTQTLNMIKTEAAIPGSPVNKWLTKR